jgi:hypothetical protein
VHRYEVSMMVGMFFRHKATGIKALVIARTYNTVSLMIPYHAFLVTWNIAKFKTHFEQSQNGFDFLGGER